VSVPYSPNVGKEVSAGAEGTYALIGIAYDGGRKHQWAIELWRNFVQAVARAGKARGDEQVVFDFVNFEFVDHADNVQKSVWKRRIWNDGPWMDPKAELLAYFETLTKGAGTNRRSRTNLAGSYGQGSRAAVLPHSNMFVATTEPGGLTHALCIVDTGHETYGLVNFTFDASQVQDVLGVFDNDVYMEAEHGWRLWLETKDLIHPTVIKNGGITTILCGPDMLDDYIDGDPMKSENARTLADDLTKLLNSPMPVSVTYMLDPTPGTTRTHGKTILVNGQLRRCEERSLKSYTDWTDRVPAGNQTSIEIDDHGTIMDVYLLPRDWNWDGPFTQAACNRRVAAIKKSKRVPKIHEPNPGQFYIEASAKDAWMPWDGKGFMVYAYDQEMIPVYGDRRGYNLVAQMKQWGITVPSVATRLAFVITPPKLQAIGSPDWGVVQSPSRASITGPNESPLPIDDWINSFFDQLQHAPDLDFLRKALDEDRVSSAKRIDPEELERLKAEILGRLDAINPIVVNVATRKDTGKTGLEGDEVEVSPEHGNGHARHKARIKRRKVDSTQSGTTFYEERHINAMPDYEFLTEDEWKDKLDGGEAEYLPEHYCVVESGGTGTTLYFNKGHEIWLGARTYYTSKWWVDTGRAAQLRKVNLGDVEDCVELQYATEGISKVFYADHVARKGGILDLSKFKDLLHPEHLNVALGGNVNVDAGIVRRIQNLLR